MSDKLFTQANLVFTGRLRENKEKGLDVAQPRTSMEKEDIEKLFQQYFPQTTGDKLNTQVLLHKVFFDIMYFTGRRGKEGLRSLSKDSFIVKSTPSGVEYIEITFNEKSKKNQGDSMSAALNALHNNHHIISEITNSELCPVSSFRKYMDLLNPEITAFFQYPTKNRKGFTKEVIGKNPLGTMMNEISEHANLSRIYTNHQIRKTMATGMHRSGFSQEEIANVTKHKNLDSLKSYVSAPSFSEKQRYNEGLFSYGNSNSNSPQVPKRLPIEEKPDEPKKKEMPWWAEGKY